LREIHSRAAFLLLAALVSVPLFGAIASEVTLPVGGYLKLPNDLVYRTEFTITNHSDQRRVVLVSLVADGFDASFRGFTIEPHETKFLADGGFGNGAGLSNFVGAMRFRSVVSLDDEPAIDDPAGQLEVESFVVAERGAFGSRGTSRQEVAAIPASEYTLEEMVFVGVRNEAPLYTNVGIANLHPTQSEKFFVKYQFLAPIEVVVPPLSSRQIRIPGPGNAGRIVRVYPEWAIGDGAPARTTPWVAYASTVDGLTGDAFSGTRVPAMSWVNE
jgi:hypothetical protein